MAVCMLEIITGSKEILRNYKKKSDRYSNNKGKQNVF